MADLVPKAKAGYKLGAHHCGACEYFYAENEKAETGKCKKVEGPIGEVMGCDLFERAAGPKGHGPPGEAGRVPTKKTGMKGKAAKKS